MAIISVKNLQNQIDNLTNEIETIKTKMAMKVNFINPIQKSNNLKYLKIFKMDRNPGNLSCQVSFIASIMSDYGSITPETDLVNLSTRNSNRIPNVVNLSGGINKRWFTTDDGSNIWLWCKTAKYPSNINLIIISSESVEYKTTGVFESSETEPPDIIWQDNNILNSDIVYGAVFN
jgi:hypothetical protein